MSLSREKVEDLLRDGRLKLQYAFTPEANKPERAKGRVDVDDETSPQTAFFRKNTSGCRIQLTVGPYARSHAEIEYSGRTYTAQSGVVDITAGGSLTVEPRETITLLTNEYVEFPDTHWALVTPRVTMTDAGFLLTTAYVDPGYHGLLRVTLHNATDFRQTINLCEPIAQMFIEEVEGRVDPHNRDELAKRSVFYGSNWERLFNEAAEPFPRRKVPLSPIRLRDRAKNQWRLIRTRGSAAVRAIGVLAFASLLVGALVAYGSFKEQLAGVERLEQRVVKVEGAKPIVGEVSYVFSGTSTTLRIAIPTNTDLSRAQIFAQLKAGSDDLLLRSRLQAGQSGPEIVIELNAQGSSSTASHEGSVAWAILP